MSKNDNTDNEILSQTKESNNRRSFLKKGAIAAPVIASVASKPVWGSGICALSGSLSGNLSNHGDQMSCDGPVGRSPGYWSKWEKITSCKSNQRKKGLNRIYHWKMAGYSPTDLFSLTFGASPLNAHTDTLGAVMRTGAGTDSFERHVVAALLSASHPAMAGLVPYTPQQVKDAFLIVNNNPGSQQANDIIEIFDSLFDNHDEVSLGKVPSDFALPEREVAQLCAIVGAPSPLTANTCS